MIDELTVGTPKTLTELVQSILCTRTRDFKNCIATVVRDYLAQKFNAAMLKNPECTQVLEKLFQDCINPLK